MYLNAHLCISVCHLFVIFLFKELFLEIYDGLFQIDVQSLWIHTVLKYRQYM